MPNHMWVCLNAACTVMLFKNKDGCCARCGQPGRMVPWSLKQGGK